MVEPTLSQVREALQSGRDGPRLTEGQAARSLFCSERTLRRRLRASGTTFARERNAVRAQVAFDLLQQGYSAAQVARRVGVTPDHLRVIVRDAYGCTPRKISLVARVARRLEEEPSSLRELDAARRDDLLMQELLSDIGAGHPLNDWAKSLVLLGFHQKRETAEYLSELRKRERANFERKRQRVEAEVVMALPLDELAEIDFAALLEEKGHARAHMLHTLRKRRERAGKRRVAGRTKVSR